VAQEHAQRHLGYGTGRMTTGLTLGKLAPFHRGHQYLIEAALQQVDQLIVLVYECPGLGMPPVHVRAGWIRSLYPQVDVIEGADGPTCVGDSPEVMRVQEEYILQKLRGRKITHFFSSEFYGEHVSRALGALDCRVDPARSHVPVSGTAVRMDPFAHRAMIHPVVYRDLIAKVVFLGAPSTGKTTLAQAMAIRFDTVWMAEYGREYWEQHQVNRRLSPDQLVDIAEEHLHREEQLVLQANRVLFVDTNAITTYMFSMYYHGFAKPRLEELARTAEARYRLTVVCGDDIPYDDTWDRSGEVKRRTFQQEIVNDLQGRGVRYCEARGSLAKRIEYCSRMVAGIVAGDPG